eukprot:3444384-Amphidinium_carterae.1
MVHLGGFSERRLQWIVVDALLVPVEWATIILVEAWSAYRFVLKMITHCCDGDATILDLRTT